MLLRELAETSERISATPRRLDKIALLADLLKRAAPGETALAVSYLSGEPRQGKIGVAYRSLQEALDVPPAMPPLPMDLAETDRLLDAIAATSARAGKQELLRTLLSRASHGERRMLMVRTRR